jgi:hypothetical protein
LLVMEMIVEARGVYEEDGRAREHGKYARRS